MNKTQCDIYISLWYSCLGNLIDERGTWQATQSVGSQYSQTQLSNYIYIFVLETDFFFQDSIIRSYIIVSYLF